MNDAEIWGRFDDLKEEFEHIDLIIDTTRYGSCYQITARKGRSSIVGRGQSLLEAIDDLERRTGSEEVTGH